MTFDELVKPADHGERPDMAGIRLPSPSFGDHQPIPARHAVEGRHDFGEEGYGGPLAPVGDGPHRSISRVYAASAPLGFAVGASAEDLRRALEGKELASGTLEG